MLVIVGAEATLTNWLHRLLFYKRRNYLFYTLQELTKITSVLIDKYLPKKIYIYTLKLTQYA